jgi:hypothetical protein
MKTIVTFLAALSLIAQAFCEDSQPLKLDAAVFNKSGQTGFTVIFQNQGEKDLLLNGGWLLGNGSQLWSSVTASLTDDEGTSIPVISIDKVGGIAGRVYFLGLPLPAGSRFELKIDPKYFYFGKLEKLTPGLYHITFHYHGIQSESRDRTQLPPCWTGDIQSPTLDFTVL